ncbi:MAG: regulatory protein RecX [Buchananella hordeovulneris]|nr:regulatory protein RecX [Buchananella hordeovulneris]
MATRKAGPGSPGPAASPAEQVDLAREAALRSLTACARTRAQLEQSLARKGFEPPVIAQVLDRLTEVGLVDDAAYARALVRDRAKERGLSRKAIAVELSRKGIAGTVAREALEELDPDSERATALELARAKARATRGLDYQVRARRTLAHLGRKGYGSEVANWATRAALAADPQEEGRDGDYFG